MEPWYKVATPRKEVREGRSFNPDEFAIHYSEDRGLHLNDQRVERTSWHVNAFSILSGVCGRG